MKSDLEKSKHTKLILGKWKKSTPSQWYRGFRSVNPTDAIADELLFLYDIQRILERGD